MAGLKITEEKANTAQQSGVLGIVPVEAGKERVFVYLAPSPVCPWLSPAMASPPPFGAGSARGQANSRSVGGTSRRGEGGGVQAPEAGGCRRAENFPRLQVGLDDRALSSVRSKSKLPPPSTK